jgi:hypothetical protein
MFVEYWKEGQKTRAKMYMAHVIKSMKFGLQICHYGAIKDFSDGDDIRQEILKFWCESWEELESKYKPKFDQFEKQLKQLIHDKKEDLVKLEKTIVESRKKPQDASSEQLIVTELLKKIGVDEFAKVLSIEVKTHPHYKNLIHLSHDKVILFKIDA